MKDIDKYVEEKAMEFLSILADCGLYASPHKQLAKDFIRTIVEDCKPKVDMAFVKEWNNILLTGYKLENIHGEKDYSFALKQMLREAGVEVER